MNPLKIIANILQTSVNFLVTFQRIIAWSNTQKMSQFHSIWLKAEKLQHFKQAHPEISAITLHLKLNRAP